MRERALDLLLCYTEQKIQPATIRARRRTLAPKLSAALHLVLHECDRLEAEASAEQLTVIEAIREAVIRGLG